MCAKVQLFGVKKRSSHSERLIAVHQHESGTRLIWYDRPANLSFALSK